MHIAYTANIFMKNVRRPRCISSHMATPSTAGQVIHTYMFPNFPSCQAILTK